MYDYDAAYRVENEAAESRARKAYEDKLNRLIESRKIKPGSVVRGSLCRRNDYGHDEWYVLVDNVACVIPERFAPPDQVDMECDFIVLEECEDKVLCDKYPYRSRFGLSNFETVWARTLRLAEKNKWLEHSRNAVGKILYVRSLKYFLGVSQAGALLVFDDDFGSKDRERYLCEITGFSEETKRFTVSCQAAMNRIYDAHVTEITREGLEVETDPMIICEHWDDGSCVIPKNHIDIHPIKNLNDYFLEHLDVKIKDVFGESGKIYLSHRLVQEERLKESARSTAESGKDVALNRVEKARPSKVIIDGKNVIAWGSSRPSGKQVCHVSYLNTLIESLETEHIQWFCFLDANTPFFVSDVGTEEDVSLLSALLKRYDGRIVCVNGGHEADDDILYKANRENCDVISCDNFQKPKYLNRYPWLRIKDDEGRYLDGINRRVHSFVIAEGEMVIQSLGLSATITNRLDAVVCGKPAMDRNASHKENGENVWQRIVSTYSVNQTVVRPVGKVISALGVFVELEADFDGLIHISRIAGLNGRNIHDVFKTGQNVTVRIVSIDQKTHRVQLATSLNETLQQEIPSGPCIRREGMSVNQEHGPDNRKSEISEDKKPILIDGSNIIRYFADMRSKALAFLVEGLEANGFAPVVLFDANISYVLKDNGDDFGLELVDRYKRERPERTIVVPSGMRSDDYLLLLADKRGYPIISCDTYKDEAYAQYAWLKNRVETGEKRVHAPTFVLGDLVIPTLGIVWSIGK